MPSTPPLVPIWNGFSALAGLSGVPAKLRRELGDKDRALILEYAQNYLDYTEIYLRELAGGSCSS